MKVATVGCGYFSHFHHQAWQRLEVELVGVCDLDAKRAEEFRHQYGIAQAFDNFSDMLSAAKPDLVDIILPPDQHFPHIMHAAKHGADIICQKPFTQCLSEARQAVDIAASANVMLMVHENFRFQPWYRLIKTLLDKRLLGQLFAVRFLLRPGDGQGPDAYLNRQPYFQKMERFLIRETGIHFIDVFRFLLGEPESVYADLQRFNPHIRGEDAGQFVLDFPAQLRAVFDGNRLVDHLAQDRRLTMGELTIEGECGVLRLDGNGHIWHRIKGSNEEVQLELHFDHRRYGGDCVYALQKHVLECLVKGGTPENIASDYIRNLEIQEAIYRSNQTHKKVSLDSQAKFEEGK